MGSSRLRIRACDFAVRCCHGASYAVGFLTTLLFLMAILWILWCYFGLSIVQVSTGQRRALVNYSFTKPTQTPSTAQPSSAEASSNTISKSAVTTSSSSFHKARDLSTASTVPPPPLNTSTKLEIKDEGIQTRRVSTTSDNHRESTEPIQNKGTLDLSKTSLNPVSKMDTVPDRSPGQISIDEGRTPSREYPKESVSTAVRDDILGSRRPSDTESATRIPDFNRDPPRTYMKERTRYDGDDDEYRGTRSRSDTRDRVRDRVPYVEDRYSKGDTRSYPDDDYIARRSDQKRRDDRYDDVPRRRGDDYDDDRIRDDGERYRYRDDDSRYRSRDTRYDDRDERYRSRDDDRYSLRDDDRRYRSRSDKDDRPSVDDKYRSRYDDREIPRNDDRDRPLKVDDRDRPIRIEGRVIPKIDDRDLPPRNDDRDKPLRIDDRDRPIRIEDRERPKIDDRDLPLRIDDRARPLPVDDRDKTRIDDRDIVASDGRGRARIDDSDRRIIDDRYRVRDDSVNRRKEDKSDARYEDREKVGAEERYRLEDDDRDKARGYRNRDSYIRGVTEDEDDHRSRVESRRRDEGTRYSERDRYRPRGEIDPYDDTRSIRRDYKDPTSSRTDDLPPLPIRKSSSDRDFPLRRSEDIPSSVLSETRRRDRDDEYRRPSRYEDDRDSRISPTRVRDDTYSTSLGSRSRSEIYPPALSGSRIRDPYPEDDRRRTSSFSGGISGHSESDDRREYKTRLPAERVGTRYADRFDEVVLDRRSYSSEEDDDYRDKSNSRSGSDGRRDSKLRDSDEVYEPRRRAEEDAEYSRRRKIDEDDEYPRRRKDDAVDAGEYPRRRKDDDEEYRREISRSDLGAPRTKPRDSYDDYGRDSPSYDEDRPVRRYDDTLRRRDDADMRKDDRLVDHVYPSSKIDEPLLEDAISSRRDRKPMISDSPRISPDTERRVPIERPLNAKDVIEAALRHSDLGDAPRKVSYPVLDPRVSNLTSPDVIRPSERRGSTILSRRRRRIGV